MQKMISITCSFKPDSYFLNPLMIFCLFGLRFYVLVNNFSVMSRRSPWLNQYKAMKMKCLAQGHNTPPLVRDSNTRPCTLPTELMVLPNPLMRNLHFAYANNKGADKRVSVQADQQSNCSLTRYRGYLSLVVRKPVFGVSDQVRHKPGKPGCTATEDG